MCIIDFNYDIAGKSLSPCIRRGDSSGSAGCSSSTDDSGLSCSGAGGTLSGVGLSSIGGGQSSCVAGSSFSSEDLSSIAGSSYYAKNATSGGSNSETVAANSSLDVSSSVSTEEVSFT